MNITPNKIGIFGGTFDPPHKGHTGLANEIMHYVGLDKIIFLPAFIPPHKPTLPVSPFNNRKEMLDIALRINPRFEVSTAESDRIGRPSYTKDSLDYFSRLMPGAKIYLIIGSDSLLQLHTWFKASEIVAGWQIIAYPRPDYPVSLEALLKIWDEKTASGLYKSVLPLKFFDISSTEIRNKVKNGQSLDDLLESGVYNYIKTNALYS